MNTDQYRSIRAALRVNAGFSILTGLPLIFAPAAMANLLGLTAPSWIIMELGISLLGFAGLLFWTASRQEPSIKMVNVISGMDILWVLGSAELLIFNPFGFNATGKAIVLVCAVFVALFAAAQITAVVKFKRGRNQENESIA